MDNVIYVANNFDFGYYEQIFNIKFNQTFDNLSTVTKHIWYEPHYQFDRHSIDLNLWSITPLPKFAPPDYSLNTNLTFNEITDRRAAELEHYLDTHDTHAYVCWSGGIDSTCILSAIVKNWAPRNFERVTVLMNSCSYFENPVFFNKVIKQNFAFDDLSVCMDYPWTDTVFVTGEPADPIWLQADVLEFLNRYPGQVDKSLAISKDALLNMLSWRSGSMEHAEWFFEYVTSSANSAGVSIQTPCDFYWWTNFNFYFTGNCLKQYISNLNMMKRFNHNSELFQSYIKNYWPWYSSSEYQLWSYHNNNNGVKIKDTIQSYKHPAKQYIRDIDRNDYYFSFKTKTGSGGFESTIRKQMSSEIPRGVFAITENGGAIMAEDHERIYQLIKNNPKVLD